MRSTRSITLLFTGAAIYDGVLGVAFIVFPAALYHRFGVTPPNHWGYVDFGAALLIVFALMFVNIARRPQANRNLIPYGVLLKLSYCAVVFRYWLAEDIPGMWKPLAFADAAFVLAFLWAYVAIGGAKRPEDPARQPETSAGSP
ncbi:MAG: hypothetical protein KKB50_19470 [Planctomycetes bacterium]|nr:hypothetical protein [Planctomycetota bacterium]